jgi:hypothetical protein
MKKILFTCFMLINSVLLLSAQKARITQVWDKTFGGSGEEVPRRAVATSDGGFIITGRSSSPANGDKTEAFKGGAFDYWIVKTDRNGNKLWDKSYGGAGDDVAQCILLTADGHYLVGGYSTSGIGGDKSQANRGDWDFWLLKIDASGRKIWDKTFGGSSKDIINAIVATTDGGYLLGGPSSSTNNGDRSIPSRGSWDYWVVKIDSLGNKVWDQAYGGSGRDDLMAMIATPDNGFLLAGWSESGVSNDKISPSFGQSDEWIIKINASGAIQWQKALGGDSNDYPTNVILTENGDFLISGYSSSIRSGNKSENALGQTDYWVIRLNALGTIIWDKTFGGSGLEQMENISLSTVAGNILLAGFSASPVSGNKTEPNRGGSDYWLIEIDSLGNKIWEKVYGGSGDDRLFGIVPAVEENRFLLVGQSNSPISGEKSEASRGGNDYWVVNVSIEPNSIAQTPTTEAPFSLYPNPATERIMVYAPASEPITLHLTDVTGKYLRTLYQGIPAENGMEVEFQNRSAGIYFLQLQTASGRIVTQKLILQP